MLVTLDYLLVYHLFTSLKANSVDVELCVLTAELPASVELAEYTQLL